MFKEPNIDKNLKLDYALTRDVTERGLKEYKEFLEIPITRKFLGEKVLDLGSGITGKFAKEAAEQGIEIYSLTPALIKAEARGKRESKDFEDIPVAGLVQNLPYKSNVFDSILSVWAVPAHLPEDEKDYIESFKEILRVLKPGGKAFLAPIVPSIVYFDLANEAIRKIKKEQPLKNKFKEGRRGTILILTKPEEKKE
jgi:ubiquinone/menaquinone biosynthesis C-methylase UbiE